MLLMSPYPNRFYWLVAAAKKSDDTTDANPTIKSALSSSIQMVGVVVHTGEMR